MTSDRNDKAAPMELSELAIADIRRAVVYGLHGVKEVIRLRHEAEGRRTLGLDTEWPVPTLPMGGAAETLQPFADALLWLEVCDPWRPEE